MTRERAKIIIEDKNLVCLHKDNTMLLENTIRTRYRVTLVIAAILGCTAAAGKAEQTAEANDVAQANNPLANFTAFSMHNYYIGELTSSG